MKPVILFRASLAEEEELLTAKKYFEVVEQRNSIKDSYVIGRYSTLPYYKELEEDLKVNNSILVNSYEQYNWIANFDWYEQLEEFTFKTWFSAVELPDDGQFVVKGRTNSRKQHWDTKMYAKSKGDAIEIGWKLSQDSLIGSQGIVYRKFEKLVTYETGINGLPFTNEWRCFFYKGQLVSYGYYWSIADKTKEKEELPKEALDFVQKVADIAKNHVNAFVLDIAQKENGDWVLVEVNDFQMAGLSCINYDDFYSSLAELISTELISTEYPENNCFKCGNSAEGMPFDECICCFQRGLE